MKGHLMILLAVLLPSVALHAEKTDRNIPPVKTLTWGARIGFAATGTYLSDAFMNGHEYTEYLQDTQVGNFAALQFRLNTRKLLIQSGLGLSFNKSSYYLDKNSWNENATSKDEISCSYSMISLTVPLQFGFNIINRYPYCMPAFTGPLLRYTPDKYYSVEYKNFQPYQFTDSPTRFILGWTAGFSVQIGRTFLDFEYEATISNVAEPMYETTGADPAPDYKLNRRASIISFSYGIMF